MLGLIGTVCLAVYGAIALFHASPILGLVVTIATVYSIATSWFFDDDAGTTGTE